MSTITETLHSGWGQYFTDYEILFEEKTKEQHLLLIETSSHGRVLFLDGVVQLTEKDNFIYHEMLTHVPIFAHGDVRNVLIIGGGDGGIAKQALAHPHVQVTQVEIDEGVVTFSKKFLPEVSSGALDDPRMNLVIYDGAKFVKETSEKYDVIIIDSTDPIGPGEVLFTKEFYTDCSAILTESGILVTQNGAPFMQQEELQTSVQYFRDIFAIGTCYLTTVPTYVGGPMALGFATNNNEALHVSLETLRSRYEKAGLATEYYNPEAHIAAFALPEYIRRAIE